MQSNIIKVTTTEYMQKIREARKVTGLGHDGSYSGMPIIGYGRAGCGKTYAPRAVAEEDGTQYALLDGITMTPTDVGGQRFIPHDGIGDYLRRFLPDWLKGSDGKPLDPEKPAIINVTEITKAGPMVTKGLLNIIQERRIGDYELGRNWLFVIDGNFADDKGGDIDIVGPFRNRCAQFHVENSTHTFLRDFAEPNNLHPYVQTFLKRYDGSSEFPKGALNTWDGAENPAAWASERAWTNMSSIIYSGLPVSGWANSVLGNQVGEFFSLHCDMLDQLATMADIRSNPDTCQIPDDIIIAHMAGVMIAAEATPQDMGSIATYLRRFPYEAAASAMAEIVRRKPDCRETRAYTEFRQEYKMPGSMTV